MITTQYLVLHSGDRLVMKTNYYVYNVAEKTKYLNDNLQDQIRFYELWVKEIASHIELEAMK